MGDHHLHLFGHGPLDSARQEPNDYPIGLIDSYVEAAAQRGVTELGFTEHFYRCLESDSLLGPFWKGGRRELAEQTEAFVKEDRVLSLDRYVEAVLSAKGRGLPVKLGLEVDYFPDSIEAVTQFLAAYPFDFLIGSIHWIGEWSVDHHDVVGEFERRGVDQAYEDYFSLEADLAGCGHVDVLAHADVIKKFGHRPSSDLGEWYARVATAAARSGTGVEVSSGGLRQPVAEIYPAEAFLDKFFEEGVAITLASDGHDASEAGFGHSEVVAAARRAGYSTRLSFDQRTRTEVPL